MAEQQQKPSLTKEPGQQQREILLSKAMRAGQREREGSGGQGRDGTWVTEHLGSSPSLHATHRALSRDTNPSLGGRRHLREESSPCSARQLQLQPTRACHTHRGGTVTQGNQHLTRAQLTPKTRTFLHQHRQVQTQPSPFLSSHQARLQLT